MTGWAKSNITLWFHINKTSLLELTEGTGILTFETFAFEQQYNLNQLLLLINTKHINSLHHCSRDCNTWKLLSHPPITSALTLHCVFWPVPSSLRYLLSQPPVHSSAVLAERLWLKHTQGHLCWGRSSPHSDRLDHGWGGAVLAPVDQKKFSLIVNFFNLTFLY